MIEEQTIDGVREYYGRILETSADLKTSACCSVESMPPFVREIAARVHPEVTEKFYGCGSPIPQALEGRTVLDLGSGSGRDCFILSKLVGPFGRVIGVDMTEEQLAVARRHVDYHTGEFGFPEPNITFLHGYIEDLRSLGIEDNSVDVVVSNCVLNLSPDKQRVFREIFRVLKPGGELYFSDVFADRRIPSNLAGDPVLLGECLGGAMYIEDFRRMLVDLGCPDYRLVTRRRLSLDDEQIEKKVGMIGFYSMTVRLFKLGLEDRCEDYGQVAWYQGGVANAPHVFTLDDHHSFEVGRPVPVCGNTAAMLTRTRYGRYFQVVGDTSTHFGLFDCNEPSPQDVTSEFGACC